jgi:hypothetical protein
MGRLAMTPMTSRLRDWAPAEVPPSFWDAIAAGQRDLEKFRSFATTLSRDELREMYDQYTSLAHQLLTEKHLAKLGPDVTDDAWMAVADWVVMQGRDFYWDVFEDPNKTPSREHARGRTFASVLVQSFGDRFGEWI